MINKADHKKAVCIIGLGSVGQLSIRILLELGYSIYVDDTDQEKIDYFINHHENIFSSSKITDPPDFVILSLPSKYHLSLAESFLETSHVVSLCDSLDETKYLLELNELALKHKKTLVIGAGFSPGLSCLLVSQGVNSFDSVNSISVSKTGTAGPSCAIELHRSLKGQAMVWEEEWLYKKGGSGRKLEWFSEPIGSEDCYYAALSTPILLQPYFKEVNSIEARVSANRRDKLTSGLPMLRKPHSDGGPGAIRVEVSGIVNNEVKSLVYSVTDHPSYVSAVVASLIGDRLSKENYSYGATGLAGWLNYQEMIDAVYYYKIRISLFK